MKVIVVVGTRPELIKMYPVIRELENHSLNYFILHTGQHYSYNLDEIFFRELKIPRPKYCLNVGSGSHAEETGKILVGVEKILKRENPDVMLVEGDTNTTLAAALAAVKLGVSVGHVEAGLRSFDRSMPEEVNRVLTDHISDFLFAPTKKSKQNLVREGISEEKVFVTGNTVVDALTQNLKHAEENSDILERLRVEDKKYFLVTTHREENVDNVKRISGILDGLKMVYEEFNLPIIFPIHPRTKKRIKEFNLNLNNLTLIEPLGYLDFLKLESRAKLVLTDSGGIQEEACVLRVPCVTLRYNTERPETLDVGANILVGTEPKRILEGVKFMLGKDTSWDNPFGDGQASKRIVKTLVEKWQGC